MPGYTATVIIDDLPHTSARAAAEGAYFQLLMDLIWGQCKLEVRGEDTGKVETIELPSDLEDDESMLRYMVLVQLGSKFLSEGQKEELLQWEHENLDGHSISTSDWPGWEQIIGKKPKKFRYNLGLE